MGILNHLSGGVSMQGFLANCLGILGAWFVVLIVFNILNIITTNLFGINFLKTKSDDKMGNKNNERN